MKDQRQEDDSGHLTGTNVDFRDKNNLPPPLAICPGLALETTHLAYIV